MNALLAFRKEWLGADVLAGLTVAAVVIPKAMAYATVAGLPVQVGLYTAFLPMVIYALLGTSRALSVSTTTTLAILAGADLAELARAGDPASLARAVATMTFLVGGILVIASILRLGFVASFISAPVLVGFKAGIGLVIVFDQVPKLLGLHFAKVGFLRDLASYQERSFYYLVLDEAQVIKNRRSLVTRAVGSLTADWGRFFEWKRIESENDPRTPS